MSEAQFWHLTGFESRLDTWIASESPSRELQRAVSELIVSRFDDPYQGVTRQLDVGPNYWFGAIPGTVHNDHVVVCGYWIYEWERTIRCDTISSLGIPI